jgi:hypothetical protein
MAEELANEAEVEEDERSMLERAEHGGDDRRERREGRRNGRRRSSARRSPGERHS